MIDKALSDKLAALAGRIEARIAELKARGDFADVHAAAFADIDAKRTALEARMESLVATGNAGGAAALELARDVDALVDGFESAVFSIDAKAVRGA